MNKPLPPQKDTYDPITKSWREGQTVDSMWLTTKYPLTGTQRLGFTLISWLILFCGSALLRFSFTVLTDSIAVGLLVALGSAFFVYLGLRGLWRVFRDVFLRSSND